MAYVAVGHLHLEWALRFTCPMPPTSNDCYFYKPNGQAVLKAKARKYLRTFVGTVIQNNPHLIEPLSDILFDPDKKYSLWIDVFFERLKKKRRNQGTSIWLEQDLDRRLTVLQDGIKRLMGVSDAAFFDIRAQKWEDRLNPRVVVLLRENHETKPF